MTDIVKRLRAYNEKDDDRMPTIPEVVEAADEIERLRAALEKIAHGIALHFTEAEWCRRVARDAMRPHEQIGESK